jgi:peptidoglycan/LPS O-acetylase OafA/YrhL
MLKQLTFTRFIAAVAIVIYHYGIHVRPFTGSILRTLFSNAYIGVSYFFILSGFVMVIAYGNKSKLDVKEYYIHRVARIYPVYIIALLLTAAISLSHGINWKEFVLGATVTQAWVPKYALSLNIPGWSLSVEYLFYLLFPFLLANIYKKSNFAIVTIVILVIWLSTQTLMNFLFYSPFYKGYPSVSHNILFYFPLMRLNEFLIGNLTGLIFIKYKPRQKNYDLHLITLSTLLLIIIIASIILS